MPRLPVSKHPLFEIRNAQIVRLLRQAFPIEFIAKKFNLSRTRISAIAKEYGEARTPYTRISPRWREEIISRRRAGERYNVIAARFGRDIKTIQRLVKRYG